jgi:alpha-L-rhamnosidase
VWAVVRMRALAIGSPFLGGVKRLWYSVAEHRDLERASLFRHASGVHISGILLMCAPAGTQSGDKAKMSLTVLALCALPLATTHQAAAAVRPNQLRCEYRADPLGIDIRKPRLSWILESTSRNDRGQMQTAYRIAVASTAQKLASGAADLWDSGKVASNRTVHIPYEGQPLHSRMRCYWKVQVWDRDGKPSAWSAPGSWTMGLLEKQDWAASWIGDDKDLIDPATPPEPIGAAPVKPVAQPALMLRKTFQVNGPVRRGTLYVTAHGVYRVAINSQLAGDHVLAPEFTSYQKRLQYQTYDVTQLLRAGANGIGALVGAGWYAGRIGLVPQRHIYGTRPQLLLQLEIELGDGSTQTVVSNESWRLNTDGPIRSSDILDGEIYDARKESPGWDGAGFDDGSWHSVSALAGPGRADLVWQPNEPIRIVRSVTPVRITHPSPDVYVADMGQNMVGWCRLKLSGTAGTTVTLRHAEMLNDDGSIYTANLRGAPQVDRYTLRGGGEENFEPHFTYHGFRYVELTGLPAPPGPEAITGQVIYSSAPRAGILRTSSTLFNQILDNIVWTQRANMYSVPTDCPQRDERLGWMGDIQAFAQTAIFNMQMAPFLTKWLRDVRDDQAENGRFPDFAPNPYTALDKDTFFGAPAWADAGVIVPWRVYQNYADVRILEENFESARRWVDFVHEQNPKLLWEQARYNDYNDWLNGDTLKAEGWPATGAMVPKPVFATAFFAHSADLLSRMAAVLGRQEEAAKYGQLFTSIKEAFVGAYVTPDGHIEGDTQAGYALALNFDLLPESLRTKAAQHMIAGFERYQGHLSTGIQSTHRLMLELTRYGFNDEAYRLLNLRTFPSWGFMIENGATTIWERWDGYVRGRGFQDPGMNSFNHWALGAVGEWLWRNAAGINPDAEAPGFERFTIRPRPGGGLTSANGFYESIRGTIRSAWKIERGTFTLRIQVPPNTTATVFVPAKSADSVLESGSPAAQSRGAGFLRMEDRNAVYKVGSGRYSFSAPI